MWLTNALCTIVSPAAGVAWHRSGSVRRRDRRQEELRVERRRQRHRVGVRRGGDLLQPQRGARGGAGRAGAALQFANLTFLHGR